MDCHTVDAKVVEQTLWKNLALGVSKVESDGLQNQGVIVQYTNES